MLEYGKQTRQWIELVSSGVFWEGHSKWLFRERSHCFPVRYGKGSTEDMAWELQAEKWLKSTLDS